MSDLVHGLEGFTISARCTCGWQVEMDVGLDANDQVAAARLAKQFGEHLERCASDVMDLANAEAPQDGVSSARTIYAQQVRKGGVSYWLYSPADGRRAFLTERVARIYVERDGYRLVDVNKPMRPAST